ncbi:MAG TPA: nucleotidyltransferase domain-containing protein [Candidatus Thermoplasmatota archaeon]|nr:nucleotidyltransferase domain-containing protein [Candidatus Thermoplasmatota archaeon]
MTNDVGHLIIEASLIALSARERIPLREAAQRLRDGDPYLHAEYRLALAWAVHHHLRKAHPGIEEVYVIGSTLEDRARRTSDLDLVILGAAFNETDEDALCEMNRSISEAYRQTVGGVPPDFELLDLHLVPSELGDHPYRRMLSGSNAATYRLPT